MKDVCILQSNAVIFLRYDGQVHNHVCQIYSGFCVPEIIKIGLLLTELFKN